MVFKNSLVFIEIYSLDIRAAAPGREWRGRRSEEGVEGRGSEEGVEGRRSEEGVAARYSLAPYSVLPDR